MPTIAIDSGSSRLRERVSLLDPKKALVVVPVKDLRDALEELDAANAETARLKAEFDQRLLFEKPKGEGS